MSGRELADMARRAAEGMTDYQNVGPDEDALDAATRLVAHWESEGSLLARCDRDAELSADDLDEVRERTIAIIERAIIQDRACMARP